MKATFEFMLPEEREEYREFERGSDAHRVLDAVARELRQIRKYEEGHLEVEYVLVERIEGILYAEAGERGVEVCA